MDERSWSNESTMRSVSGLAGEWEERLSLDEAWARALRLDAMSTSGAEPLEIEETDSF